MAYSFDTLSDSAASGASTTITHTLTYTAGQSAVVWARWVTDPGGHPSGTNLSSISDGTNTYTQLGTTLVDSATGSSFAFFHMQSAAASGSKTITITLDFSTTFRAIGVWQGSGLSNVAAQGNNRQAQTSTTSLSSGNITPSSQPAALVGFFYDDSGGGAITAGNVTSRGTLSNMDAAFGTNSRAGDLRLTSTSAVAATATGANSADHYISFAVVLTEAATAVAAQADIVNGSQRNRPGRGPYSTGRYFRSIGSMGAAALATISGTSATTNANDTSAASGTTTVTGTLARTNANDTSSASGTTTVVGTSATTNANDTSSASGAVGSGSSGTVAYTNANDTSSAAGTTTVKGTSAPTNANDTAAAAGFAGSVTGTAAVTNANDSASAEGTTPRVNSGIPPRFKPVIWVHLKSEDEEVTVAEEDAAEAAEKLARKAVKRITRTGSTQTPAITVEGPVSRETKREIRAAFRAEFNRDAGVVAAKALLRAQQEQEDEETLLWLI
jgi:hypothetical protein